MTPYDFVHLVIYANDGKVEGRTKLQKMVYFVGALTGQLDRLGYRPHYYGPYSADVAGAVQELRGLNFLHQQAAGSGRADNLGFEVTRYDYELTEDGRLIAEDKTNAHPEMWHRIKDAVERLKRANISDYVRLAIAAKTDLLTRQAGQTLTPEVLKQRTSEHGWKTFTDAQYAEAIQFLDAVGLNRSASGPIAAG